MMPEIMFQLSNLGWGWNFVILALFGPFLVICSFAQWPTAVFNYVASLDQNIPTESKPPGHDFRGTMKEGIMKYKDQAWRIPFKDPTVILPHSTLQAVKKIPEPDITLNGNMYQRFFGRYTQIGTDDQELVEALKLDLTHSVPNVLGVMADEVAFGYQSVVGQPEKWTSFSTYQAMLRIVALTSGRIFVGLPLSRQEDWIEASTQHTLGSVWLSDKLRGYSPWLRPFIAPFLKERKEVQKVQDTVAKLLEPLITSRVLEMTGLDQKSPSRTDEERGRMLDWLLSRYSRKVPPNIDPQRLVRDHLTLSFAAIHVAGMALTHILHDLASKPEYIGILRSELDIEIDKCPGEVINSRALANLVKMDSFIKESLRVNPAGIVAWTRLTTVPLHLENGQTIPANTLVAYCNPRFNPSLHDYENPDEFDGLRFVKLAAANGPQARYRLDSSSSDSLGFGYGIHACPGKSFAAAELKLVVAELIRKYDLTLTNEDKKRPANIYMDFQIMPDPTAQISLRKR